MPVREIPCYKVAHKRTNELNPDRIRIAVRSHRTDPSQQMNMDQQVCLSVFSVKALPGGSAGERIPALSA